MKSLQQITALAAFANTSLATTFTHIDLDALSTGVDDSLTNYLAENKAESTGQAKQQSFCSKYHDR